MSSMRKLVSIILLYLLSLSFSYSQTNVVTGTVLSSENSAPLNAVTVRVKGKTKGVITNAEGKYSINAGAADVIEFISVGYRKEERFGRIWTRCCARRCSTPTAARCALMPFLADWMRARVSV